MSGDSDYRVDMGDTTMSTGARMGKMLSIDSAGFVARIIGVPADQLALVAKTDDGSRVTYEVEVNGHQYHGTFETKGVTVTVEVLDEDGNQVIGFVGTSTLLMTLPAYAPVSHPFAKDHKNFFVLAPSSLH
jgi:hypothetical protein